MTTSKPVDHWLYSFEANGQLQHSAVSSNHVGCSCTWQEISTSWNQHCCHRWNSNTQPELKDCYHPTSNWPYQGHQVQYIVSWGPPDVCHHCGQTLTIDHMLLETITKTCITEFPREVGFFYLIWTVRHSIQYPIWITPYLLSGWKQLWDTLTCVRRLKCPEGRVSSLNKSDPIQSEASSCEDK